MKQIFRSIWHLPRSLFVGLLWLYQKTLSPDHSFWAKAVHTRGFCKFHPTCSEYTKQVLRKYGFFRGTFKGVCRVGRCNPWSDGGIDKP
ncbi:membrane protein insertion efficiency factor YidD [Patescibacteria group bacterium]|nr:membrane protein insertion efficiency factor YidD [Patescibacteria group bacterium]MBU1016266.1 membrane protein insertion efficiency factor YidD [Patescibacteria group bacterium]MBU1685199.1 membrane protein insertion efficiency factor YidD [Patescibacteria group bacterium]MBU1938522.1 membrane protein insertion efficiency factor YidD [Patescibacteria group bacterium]